MKGKENPNLFKWTIFQQKHLIHDQNLFVLKLKVKKSVTCCLFPPVKLDFIECLRNHLKLRYKYQVLNFNEIIDIFKSIL